VHDHSGLFVGSARIAFWGIGAGPTPGPQPPTLYSFPFVATGTQTFVLDTKKYDGAVASGEGRLRFLKGENKLNLSGGVSFSIDGNTVTVEPGDGDPGIPNVLTGVTIGISGNETISHSITTTTPATVPFDAATESIETLFVLTAMDDFLDIDSEGNEYAASFARLTLLLTSVLTDQAP
jgi:hypothetical protein